MKVVAGVSNLNRRIFSVAFGTAVVWFLLSIITSQLVFFAQPMCSSHILSIPFCSWGAFGGSLTGTGFGQSLDVPLSDMECKDPTAAGPSDPVDDAKGTPIMDPLDTFSWPDGDVILRSTRNTESRDFRVHRLFLSIASPVFKDMLTSSRSSSPAAAVYLVNMGDPPRAVELILGFIYPSSVPPVLNDLATISEALIIANTYKIEVARSRLRSSLVKLAETEPLRVYAIACRLGFRDEMKIASRQTLSINLPALSRLPDEFKHVPATEYHRLIGLHARYRKEVMAITVKSLPSLFDAIAGAFDVLQLVRPSSGKRDRGTGMAGAVMKKPILDIVAKGTPLDYRSLALALKMDYGIDVEVKGVGSVIRSILDGANALNLTV